MTMFYFAQKIHKNVQVHNNTYKKIRVIIWHEREYFLYVSYVSCLCEKFFKTVPFSFTKDFFLFIVKREIKEIKMRRKCKRMAFLIFRATTTYALAFFCPSNAEVTINYLAQLIYRQFSLFSVSIIIIFMFFVTLCFTIIQHIQCNNNNDKRKCMLNVFQSIS